MICLIFLTAWWYDITAHSLASLPSTYVPFTHLSRITSGLKTFTGHKKSRQIQHVATRRQQRLSLSSAFARGRTTSLCFTQSFLQQVSPHPALVLIPLEMHSMLSISLDLLISAVEARKWIENTHSAKAPTFFVSRYCRLPDWLLSLKTLAVERCQFISSRHMSSSEQVKHQPDDSTTDRRKPVLRSQNLGLVKAGFARSAL